MIQQKFGKWKEYHSINPTAQDLFDLVLNQSEDNVKALILERYSSVYPIPFFISDHQNNLNLLYYHLAYFMKPCKTIISFGIMRASWTKCGKSTLIDEIFSTDFTGGLKGDQKLRMGQNSEQVVSSGNNIKLYPCRGKYEIGRIDIQLARNIDAHEAETKWQYLDASRFCDPSIIDHLCYKVNVILVHLLASDILNTDFKELNSKISKILTYKKRTIIFVRDVDEFQNEEDINKIDQKIQQLEKLNVHKSMKFIMIQSILLKEIPNKLPLSFEQSLQQAFDTIKEHIIKYDYKISQVFDHIAIARLYSEIHKIQLSDQSNVLYKDYEYVEKIIRGIEKNLKNQLIVIEEKQKQIKILMNEIYDSKVYGKNDIFDYDKIRSIQKQKYILESNKQNVESIFQGKEEQINQINNLIEEISQNFISDKILFYFSKYQKHQKYQSEINVIINDTDFRNGQLNNKLQENQFKNQIRDEKILKINNIYNELQPFYKSDIINDFLQLLNQERSLLLVWILTERLYHESNNNELWKLFLLNQEVFDKNLCEVYKDYSFKMNTAELQNILKKDKLQQYEQPSEEYSDYQLSIFDFFREIILLVFYSQDKNQISLKNIDQKFQMQRQKNELFFSKIKSGFVQYAQTGESFELIDGEYLRIHDLELSKLMENFIKKIQEESKMNNETRFYVISQIGRQSVGKSFLFNHMFKTKFLNRSGRCTQGINMAIRNLKNDLVKSNFTKNDKLLILDTEGLGSLDKVKRLKGKDINFDRCMVLFCLTVSNAMIITLKSEIDQETADLISVCCWALSNLKIHKMSPPHIYFVLNQQADTQQKNYMRGLNACIEQILDNPLYNKENIRENIHIKKENFFVLPSAFDQDPRNYKRLYGYHVQRSIIRPLFTEMCQSLGKKIIKSIDEDARTKLMNFEHLMKMAGDSFRTITQFPELLRYQNVNEYFCNNRLREKVQELMNLNQIMTSGYHQINQTIINKIHLTELKQIKNTPEYIDEIIEPLEDKYTQNYQNLKQQFLQFSQNEEFKNYPEIIKLNEQILSKHCIKQLQFFKNIILDLLKIKQQQKLQKKMEDKVNDQIRKITDDIIKKEKTQWWDIFEKIWNEQEKQVYKNDFENNLDDVEYFTQLLEEQYNIFQLESMDNHRMNKQQINEKFVMPFINQKQKSASSIKLQNQQNKSQLQIEQQFSKSIYEFNSLSDFEIKSFNCKEAIKQVIKDFENEIILIFQNQKINNLNPNEVPVRFFEASSKKIPAGKLSQIHGKNQQQPQYISQDSLTEIDEENGIQKIVPLKIYPKDVHHLISFLLEFKDDGKFVKEANMDVQAIKLAENLRSIKDKKQILWKKFIQDLSKNIQIQIKNQVELQDQYIKKNNILQQQQYQQQQNDKILTFQNNRYIVKDDTFYNKYNQKMIRSLDSSNIRVVMTEIQNMIQEAEFELGFIFVNFSVNCRNYLNTLGFLYCLQNRIDREDKKIKQEKEQKENFRQQYFDNFEMRMQEKQQMKLKGLSKAEMKTSDDYKSNIYSKKLLDIIVNETTDILQNSIQAQIDTMASIELSNRQIVKQINQKVKYRVSEHEEEAKNDQDIGVKYIVDYHGLIEQTFDQRWQKIYNKIFEEAKLQYRNEIDNTIFQIVNQIKYILQEMRSLLTKNNIKFNDQNLSLSQKIEDEDDEDNTDIKLAENYFQTNELFELQIQSIEFDVDVLKKYSDQPQTPKLSLQHSNKISRVNTISIQNDLLNKNNKSSSQNQIALSEYNSDEFTVSMRKKSSNQLTQFEIQKYGDMDEIDKSMIFSDNTKNNSQISFDENIEDDYSQNYLNQKFSNDIYKIPIIYLNWLLEVGHQGALQIFESNQGLQVSEQDGFQVFKYRKQTYKFKKSYSLPFFGQTKKQFQQNQPAISENNLKKLKSAGLFETQNYEIYNLYRFLLNLLSNLENSNESIQLNENVFQQLIHEQKKELEEKSKGCKDRCPACNKYCEQEFNHRIGGGIHSPHSCSIYGHQFFSMGGRIWAAETNECILVQCHDKRLNDFQSIKKISNQKEKWIDFKNKNNEWVWDDEQIEEQDPENDFGLNFMIDLHNKCGQQAFRYYKQNLDVDIKFRKYTEEDKRSMRGLSKTKQICFVIDGTYSMGKDIQKVRKAIKNLTEKSDINLELAVVIYRDHDYGNMLIEQYPSNYQFTNDRQSIMKFLDEIKTDSQKGKTQNEAALDGLAEAALYDWGNSREKDMMVIHIYDAQPHGDWPNYTQHHDSSGSDNQYCCCCSKLCQKEWKRDVFDKYKQLQLSYFGVFTHEKNYTKNIFGFGRKRYNENFDKVLQEELGNKLCKSNATTIVEKELVQIQINDIVIMERFDQR